MFNSKPTNIRIANVLIQETGSYSQQYLRPYITDTNIGGQALDELASRMVGDSGNPIISPYLAVGGGGSFVTRAAVPERSIGIANGWEQKRIRFLIEVVVDMIAGGSNSHYIMGYTDIPGVNVNTASVAHDMVFYINSITKTRKLLVHTSMGSNPIQNVCASQHLLYDNEFNNFRDKDIKRTMRPEDIYTTMGNSLMFDNDDFREGGFDSRNALRNMSVTADRSLSTPANYISSVVNNYVHASELEEFGQNQEAVIANARAQAMSAPGASAAYQDPFLQALSNLRGGVPTNGYFTYAELLQIDPNAERVTNYIVSGNTQRVQHQHGMTSGWGGSDRNTMAATMLSNSVPALMMELMIMGMSFKSTNHGIDGRPRTDILNGRGLSNVDMVANYERFKNQFERFLVNDITYNNSIGYAIEMHVDLLGETWIKVSIDNEPFVDFVTPSFCDGLFSPIITTQNNTILNMAHDFNNLIENVRDRTHQKNQISVSTML